MKSQPMSLSESTTIRLPDDPRAPLRRGVYALLIALAAGSMIGRILAVNSVDVIKIDQSLVDKEVARRTAELKARGEPIDRAAIEEEARAKVGKQRRFSAPTTAAAGTRSALWSNTAPTPSTTSSPSRIGTRSTW